MTPPGSTSVTPHRHHDRPRPHRHRSHPHRVSTTSYLRNPTQYASYFHLYRYSLQLRSKAQVLQFYVGTSTGSRTYRGCAKVYNASTHALARNLGCGGSFPAGNTVTKSISYSPDSHLVFFRARDTAGTKVHIRFADTAQSFRQARIGIELGPNPWSSPSLTRSPTVLKLGRFTNCTLTSYSGHTDGFISWWDYKDIWLKNGGLGKAGPGFDGPHRQGQLFLDRSRNAP